MDRRRLRDFDMGLLAAALALVAVGIVMVYSATRGAADASLSGLAQRQAVFAVLGLAALVGALFVPQDTLEILAPLLYGLAMALLVAVLFVGVGKMGERRWLDLGVLRFQPSELAKYAMILLLARWLARKKTKLERATHLVVPIVITLIPFGLVLREPDLGTSLMFPLILLPMLYWAGARPVVILLLLAPALSVVLAFHLVVWLVFLGALACLLYLSRVLLTDKVVVFTASVVAGRVSPLLWAHLEEYQRHRVLAFLSPEKYRFSTGYQLIQSKIAIGSGSAFGKGFLQGTQKNYAFLPEQHTDFIFSVLGEEFGFLGCAVVLALYLYLVLRMLRLAAQARNRFAGLVIVGIASMLFVQSAVNVGVTLGMSPVTGMPLPLLSYGGTSLLVTLGAIGVVLGMGIRRMEY
ncbi:MAG: rod shape-determining protein RodA [Candidatus Eisenbacteria bacterium]|nr:rod shape-determining protein RodA [Candidatus Eisenbacteria bacterium]